MKDYVSDKEDPRPFCRLRRELLAELRPAAGLEMTLAGMVIASGWTLRKLNSDLCRLWAYYGVKEKAVLIRQRSAELRSMHRNLAELRRLQTERQQRQQGTKTA